MRFTLVELLVVISIIAMLMSLLLPALSKSREMAKSILCAANLRNIAPAVIGYSDDYNGFIPISTFQTYFFTRTLAPYMGYDDRGQFIRGGKYFSCPSEQYQYLAAADKPFIGVYPLAATYMGTVIDNGAMPTTSQWGGWQCHINSAKPKNLRQILPDSVLMCETGANGSYNNCATGWGLYGITWPRPNEQNGIGAMVPPPSVYAPFYHRLTSNYLFLDGHVTNYRRGQQFDGQWRPK